MTDTYYRLRSQAQVFFANLLSRVPEQDNRDEWLFIIEQFIETIHFWSKDIPRPVLDFLLKKRHYNGIFEAVRNGTLFKGPITPVIKKFLADLKQLATSEKDPTLMACYHFYKDKPLFEADLNQIKITRWNYRLFGESRTYMNQAVDFMLGERKFDEAVHLCRRHQNYLLAGQILEKLGAHSDAGRAYRDGHLYEDALRCFQTAGDEPGMARAYERMEKLEDALHLWKGLGKHREAERLQKKVDKKMGTARQLTFFR